MNSINYQYMTTGYEEMQRTNCHIHNKQSPIEGSNENMCHFFSVPRDDNAGEHIIKLVSRAFRYRGQPYCMLHHRMLMDRDLFIEKLP
jgi:hypothetical protein